MVKIINRENHKIKECDFCGSTLKYDKEDIITKLSSTTTHKVNYKTNFIVCPDCNEKITLSIEIV